MKESSDNKSLIKVNDNLFFKIKNWFLKLFRNEKQNTESNISLDSTNKEIENKSSFIDSIKISEDGDSKIFDIQRKYENGDLKVTDLSKEEYSKLADLYKNQINNLENQLKYRKTKLSTN